MRCELQEEFLRSRHVDYYEDRWATGVKVRASTLRAPYPCPENSEIETPCTVWSKLLAAESVRILLSPLSMSI